MVATHHLHLLFPVIQCDGANLGYMNTKVPGDRDRNRSITLDISTYMYMYTNMYMYTYMYIILYMYTLELDWHHLGV